MLSSSIRSLFSVIMENKDNALEMYCFDGIFSGGEEGNGFIDFKKQNHFSQTKNVAIRMERNRVCKAKKKTFVCEAIESDLLSEWIQFKDQAKCL